MARKPTGKPPGRPRLSEEEKAERLKRGKSSTQTDSSRKPQVEPIALDINAQAALPTIQTVRTDTDRVVLLEKQLSEEKEKHLERSINEIPTNAERGDESAEGFFGLEPKAFGFYRR